MSNYRADRLSKLSTLASNIGGKLEREIKAAEMKSPQAVIYQELVVYLSSHVT